MYRLAVIASITLVFLISLPALSAKRALVIGISDYKSVKDLHAPANDVRIMSDILQGWYGFKPKNVETLVDSRATRESIERGFRRLKDCDSGDTVVIYYSGHGTLVRTKNGLEEAIVPHEGNRQRFSSLVTKRELKKWLREIPAQQVDVIMDCCYAGGFMRGRGVKQELKCLEADDIPTELIRSVSPVELSARGGQAVISADKFMRQVPDTEFHLLDGSCLRASALTFLMYKSVYQNPDVTPSDLVASLGSLMEGYGLSQRPGVSGLAGRSRLFGGVRKGIGPKVLPVCAKRSSGTEVMGGSAFDLEPGAKVRCFNSLNGKTQWEQVSKASSLRAWIK